MARIKFNRACAKSAIEAARKLVARDGREMRR